MILVCKIEPFDYFQKVYEAQDNGNLTNEIGEMQLTALYNFIPTYCHKNNIQQVKFTGNTEFCNMVINLVRDHEQNFFSKYEPIQMEVIEG